MFKIISITIFAFSSFILVGCANGTYTTKPRTTAYSFTQDKSKAYIV